MEYESTILKRLIDTYGVVGNPRYISEIIKEFIVRGKECYPNLFTYQADWLAHIDEFGLNPTYTVSYTGQSIYAPNTLERPVKSAILKGSTKHRDIDTGEVLDAFEDGRNLELVSVRMPVLTTTGKNLFDLSLMKQQPYVIESDTHSITIQNGGGRNISELFGLKHKPNEQYTFTYERELISGKGNSLFEYVYTDGTHTYIQPNMINISNANKTIKHILLTYSDVGVNKLSNICLVKGANKDLIYEPFKSNILTTNEDVELRGIGDVKDTLDCLTGEVIVKTDVFNDWDNATIDKVSNYGTVSRYDLRINVKPRGEIISNLFNKGVISTSDLECVNIHNSSNLIQTQVLTSKLSEDTVSGFREWAKNNNYTLIYELETESVKTVELTVKDQNDSEVSQLSSFNGGTHFFTSSQEGSLQPTIIVDVVTDLEETLNLCSMDGNTL